MRKQLKQMNKQIEAALKLINPDIAEAIVGSDNQEIKLLLEAVQALSQLDYSLALSFGMRRKDATLKAFSQSQMLSLQLIYAAYALGVIDGKQRQDEYTT